ncbi:MAG: oxidoreductase, partial [Candidatus Puniceispirillales bacterium]
LGFANGITAGMNTSWLSPIKEHRLTVTGQSGSLVFDDTKPWESKLVRYPMRIIRDTTSPDLSLGEGEPIPLPASEPLKDEMRAFLTMMETNTPPPSDIAEALYVQRMLERMEANAAQHLSRSSHG